MMRIVIDFLLYSFLSAVLFLLLYQFAGVQVSASGLIGSFIAAMLAGTFYSQRAGADHSAGFAWKAAAAIVAASITLTAAVFAFYPATYEVLQSLGTDPESRRLLYGAIIVGLIVSFLLIRLGFGLGVRIGMKALERKIGVDPERRARH